MIPRSGPHRRTSTDPVPARWERACRVDPVGTDSSVDVLVNSADPHHVLLQVWERNRIEEHVVEAAVRLTNSEARALACLLIANAREDAP
jgi:hypothetical protein